MFELNCYLLREHIRFVFIRVSKCVSLCVPFIRSSPGFCGCVCVCLFVSSPVRLLSQGLSGKSLQQSCCSINILHHKQCKPSHAAAAEELLYHSHCFSPFPPTRLSLSHCLHSYCVFPPRTISLTLTLSSFLVFSSFVHRPVDFTRIFPFDRSARGKINSPQSDIKK